jgi:hypothetical protein
MYFGMGHNHRLCPIWGTRYSVESAKQFVDFPYAGETYIRARVLRLMDYLYRIQQNRFGRDAFALIHSLPH